jgi:hypothetical protein
MGFFATIVMLTGLFLAGSTLFAQEQTPPAPASSSSPSAQTPPPQTEPAPDASQTQPPKPETPTPAPPPSCPSKSKPAKGKPPAKPAASGHKVVVRNGGAKDVSPQLAPGMSEEQEQHSRETTAQLLATTDANVQSVAGRQLTAAQQSLLDQIHTYMKQSKDASDAGDLSRAHTLAYKAHLLSDELKK